jgi:hypothetical protein
MVATLFSGRDRVDSRSWVPPPHFTWYHCSHNPKVSATRPTCTLQMQPFVAAVLQVLDLASPLLFRPSTPYDLPKPKE